MQHLPDDTGVDEFKDDNMPGHAHHDSLDMSFGMEDVHGVDRTLIFSETHCYLCAEDFTAGSESDRFTVVQKLSLNEFVRLESRDETVDGYVFALIFGNRNEFSDIPDNYCELLLRTTGRWEMPSELSETA